MDLLTLEINDRVVDIESLEQLARELETRGRCHYVAAHLRFISESENRETLTTLTNGEQGWMMFLRYDGDAGFSTRNPSYDGPRDAEIDYVLENGQEDEYPAAWAYPVVVLRAAILEFARSRQRPTGVRWFDETSRRLVKETGAEIDH